MKKKLNLQLECFLYWCFGKVQGCYRKQFVVLLAACGNSYQELRLIYFPDYCTYKKNPRIQDGRIWTWTAALKMSGIGRREKHRILFKYLTMLRRSILEMIQEITNSYICTDDGLYDMLIDVWAIFTNRPIS